MSARSAITGPSPRPMSHMSPHSFGQEPRLEPGHLQALRDQVGRVTLGIRQLGMGVQVASERHQLGAVPVEERVEPRRRSCRGSPARARRSGGPRHRPASAAVDHAPLSNVAGPVLEDDAARP